MAIRKSVPKLNAVSLFFRADDAFCESSDWAKYMEDPQNNKDALVIKEGKKPTSIICNFEFSGKEQSAIQNAMVGSMDSETNQPTINYGSWSYTVARFAIKDIQNPAGETDVIEFKKSGTGYVMDSVLSQLSSAGVVDAVFQCYMALKSNDKEVANAKN